MIILGRFKASKFIVLVYQTHRELITPSVWRPDSIQRSEHFELSVIKRRRRMRLGYTVHSYPVLLTKRTKMAAACKRQFIANFMPASFLTSFGAENPSAASTGSDSRQESQATFHQMSCTMGSASVLCRGTELQSSTRGEHWKFIFVLFYRRKKYFIFSKNEMKMK